MRSLLIPWQPRLTGCWATPRAKRLDLFIGGPNEADRQDFGTAAFLELVSVASPAAVILNRGEHQELGLKDQQCIAGAKMTIVTDHSHPTLVLRANGSAETVEVSPVAQIRDRTGVGDGFIAGYLASIRAGADPVSATHAGHRTATQRVGTIGPHHETRLSWREALDPNPLFLLGSSVAAIPGDICKYQHRLSTSERPAWSMPLRFAHS